MDSGYFLCLLFISLSQFYGMDHRFGRLNQVDFLCFFLISLFNIELIYIGLRIELYNLFWFDLYRIIMVLWFGLWIWHVKLGSPNQSNMLSFQYFMEKNDVVLIFVSQTMFLLVVWVTFTPIKSIIIINSILDHDNQYFLFSYLIFFSYGKEKINW